jgi:hypothetical protein
MKNLLLATLTLVAFSTYCHAQEDSQGGFFTLINTVPKSGGFKAYIATAKETNLLTPPPEVTGEAAGNGYSTGMVMWSPADGDLVAEAPNRRSATLKPFIKPGETPLVILKARGADGLDFSLLPQPVDRNSPFYDAVNLTTESQLEVLVDSKKVRLPRGQRVRLSSKNTMKYEISGGPADLLESQDPPSHLLVFVGDDNGKVQCLVLADYAM